MFRFYAFLWIVFTGTLVCAAENTPVSDQKSSDAKQESVGERLVKLVEQEKYDDALKVYQEMLNLNGWDYRENAYYFSGVAALHFLRGKPEEAARLVKECYDHKKDDPWFLLTFCHIHCFLGDHRKAVDDITKAIDEIEKHPNKFRDGLEGYSFRGDYDRPDSQSRFDVLMGMHFYRIRATLYAMLKDVPNARVDVMKAIELTKSPFQEFRESLDFMEKHPEDISCVLVKDPKNSFVMITEKEIKFCLNMEFQWERKTDQNKGNDKATSSSSISSSKNEPLKVQTNKK